MMSLMRTIGNSSIDSADFVNKCYDTPSFANVTSSQFWGTCIFLFCHPALANLSPKLLSQMLVVYQAKLVA